MILNIESKYREPQERLTLNFFLISIKENSRNG